MGHFLNLIISPIKVYRSFPRTIFFSNVFPGKMAHLRLSWLFMVISDASSNLQAMHVGLQVARSRKIEKPWKKKMFWAWWRNKKINHKRALQVNDSQRHEIKVERCVENEKKNDQIDGHGQVKPWFCLYRFFLLRSELNISFIWKSCTPSKYMSMFCLIIDANWWTRETNCKFKRLFGKALQIKC